MHCASNLGDLIFVQANDRLRTVSAVHSPQSPDEFTTVQDWHDGVHENGVGHRKRASRKRLTHVRGFGDLKVHAFENAADNFSDYGGIVHHQDMPHPQTFVRFNND